MTSMTPLRRVLEATKALVDSGTPVNAEGLCHYCFTYEEQLRYDSPDPRVPRIEIVPEHMEGCLWKMLKDAIDDYDTAAA